MSEPIQIDAELRELLGDIAGDPASSLLRVPPAKRRALLFERDPRAFPSATFLTNAERHLLSAFREEVGRLLHAYSIVITLERPPLPGAMFADGRAPGGSPEQIDERAKAAIATTRGGLIDVETAALLADCINDRKGVSASALCSARMRLTPHDHARGCHLIYALIRPKEPRATAILAHHVAHSTGDVSIASHLHEGIGWWHFAQGGFEQACQAYRLAAELDDSRVAPVLFWMASARCLQLPDEAIRAAQRLDAMAVPNHPAVLKYVRFISMERSDPVFGGPLESSPPLRAFTMKLRDRVGPTSRTVFDAFL